MSQTAANQQARLLWLRQHSQHLDALLQHYSAADMQNLLALDVQQQPCALPQHQANQQQKWLPATSDAPSLEHAQQSLRQAKQHGMPYFLWWELGLHGDIETSARHLALWASSLLETALTMAKQLVLPRFGALEDTNSAFSIIGLGKLGGMELNLGSDVDLIFVWDAPAHAQTTGGRTTVAANTYFQHLARMLIRLMDERTVHGITWLTDMRLRPNGDGAPLCLNLQATLNHYQDHGQTWERAMLLKASVVAGSQTLGQALIAGLSPFIWRQYLDYTTVQALSEMKRRIDVQAGEQAIAMGFDVKRGSGGIREIEFMIQSLQLLHAGRESNLRLTSSMPALALLTKAQHISAHDADILRHAYRFWRQVEHAIQAESGQHTHALGKDWQSWLSAALNIAHIKATMQHHANQVHPLFQHHFDDLSSQSSGTATWLEENQSQLQARVAQQFPEIATQAQHAMLQALLSIQTQLHRQLLPERSAAQIQHITTYFLQQWQGDANAVTALQSWADLLHHIAGRATWIDLLANHQLALTWLGNMLASSGFIAQHIARNPTWLEWPLQQHQTSASRIQGFCTQIHDLHAENDHEEVFLASLGRLVDQARLTTAIHIASHDDVNPLQVGRWLSDIADAAVLASLRLALAQYQLPHDFPMLALAMGKHGSQSMGLVSDLDMVFILVHPQPFAVDFQNKNNREWAQRVGRRMIQHLRLPPPYGAGFEFDARLRPSGNAGVLVTTLQAFASYQRHEAQTWEHQALCRARCLAVNPRDITEVSQVILDILHQPRSPQTLRHDVQQMRDKMLLHLASKSTEIINLKHDQGGLVDIEFLAQYARLLFHIDHSSTVATLQHLPEHAAPAWHAAAPVLVQRFLAYRQLENSLRVHLWASVARLPADDNTAAWKTLRRHTCIKSVAKLKQNMHDVQQIFKALLEEGKQT